MEAVMHDFSKRALLAFIENAIDKGRVNVNTGGGIRAACNKLLEQVALEDDVRSVDLKTAVVQYANRHPGELSGDSLRVYESRVRTAIDAFVQAATDPTSFTFKTKANPANGVKRSRGSRAGGTKDAEREDATVIHAPADMPQVLHPRSTPSLKVPFPLRADFLAEVVIPRDLTKDEAKRLMVFIDALAQDSPSQ
jgi:hypothetical protein